MIPCLRSGTEFGILLLVNKSWLAMAVVVLLAGGSPSLRAAEEGTYEQLLREIVNLRVDIAQQRREISALRDEVGQMHAKLEGKTYRKVASVPTAATPETYADVKEPAATEEPAPAKTKPAKTNKEPEPAEPAKAASGTSYKVKAGDTMSSIARGQKITLEALKSANPGIEPKALKVGMELKMP